MRTSTLRFGCASMGGNVANVVLVAGLLLSGLWPALAVREITTLVSGLDDQRQVAAFCSSVRYCMAEPVTEPRTQGKGAMRVRFFAHPSLQSDPQVAATSRRRGLHDTDWRPYQRVAVDLFNLGDDPLDVVFFCASGEREYSKAFTLTPGKWTVAEMTMADIVAAGLDLGAMTALGLRADMRKRTSPSRIVVDNVRLVGTDAKGIAAAVAAAKEQARKRPAYVPVRTEAADAVVRVEDSTDRVERTVLAPVVARPEVLVVGGGLAGVAAAVTAARTGAETLLVERTGSLGGMATIGRVQPAFRDDLTGGMVRELTARLQAAGGQAQMWNPEVMKVVLLRMMRESRAKLMLYTMAVGAIVRHNVIRGVFVESKSGPQAILANIVVDCTGDGDVAASAGVPFEVGRGRDDQTQTQTLVFVLGNVNTSKLNEARWNIAALADQARARGDLHTRFAGDANIDPVILGEHGVVKINSINIPQVSGLKVEDLTYAQIEAQEEALDLVAFYRKYVPGCEECYLLDSAEVMGVRETRRIVGEYVLTGEDVLSGATFRDAIARGFYPVDVHSADDTGDVAGMTPAKPYEIPYRCLVPKKIENLLVAGRCISADHVAHASLRVMGTTMPLGEAAGCAAGMCIAKHRRPRTLDGAQVRSYLRSFGAWPHWSPPEPGTKGISRVPDNLALAAHGVVATADSVLRPGAEPGYAVDGVISELGNSRWLSGPGPLPHWIQLDFPQPITFSYVQLHFYRQETDLMDAFVPRGFEVQVASAAGWRTVASASGNTQLDPELKFAPVAAKTMRVLFTVPCPADNIVRLRELEVK